MQTESSPRHTVDELFMEKFAALLAECDLVADTAGYGQTLDLMETFFSDQGRKFLQETFEQKLQERVQRTETTAEAKQCPHCKKTHYQNKKTKDLTTVHGHLTLERCYRYCPHCKTYSFPVEGPLGLATLYTTHLTRLATRCCGLWSYEVAADNLDELAGIRLSHTTIGKIANETAGKCLARRMNVWTFTTHWNTFPIVLSV